MSAALKQAAQSVLDRWDSPQWEWAKHGPTADLMAELRKAIEAEQAQQEPMALPPEAFAQPVPVVDAPEMQRLREHNQYLKTLVTNNAIRLTQLEEFARTHPAVEAQQEPVAEVYRAHYGGRSRNIGFDNVRPLQGVTLPPPGTKLYAAPQQAQAPGWMPIETAPRDGSLLILWWGNAVTFAKWLDNSKCQYPWAGWQTPSLTPRPSGEPSHWMPRPTAPKEGGKHES